MIKSKEISIVLLIQFTLNVLILSKRYPIRVVEEPTSFGSSFQSNFQNPSQIQKRVNPQPFSGPDHLRILKGKCFTLLEDSYKYSFCPFDNVTQHEQNFRWNPYHGILGIWSYWEVEDERFKYMLFKSGDDCPSVTEGEKQRSVKVHLLCGSANNITKVWEPSTCRYELNFTTPLVCHEDSLLIYPTLNQTLRKKVDELESDLENEILTKEGYKTRVRTVYIEAGVIKLPSNSKKLEKKTISYKESFQEKKTCSEDDLKELERLKERIQKYENILKKNNITVHV